MPAKERKRPVVTKATQRTKTERAKGRTEQARGTAPRTKKAPAPPKGRRAEHVERVPVSRLRTLGAEQNVERAPAPKRTRAEEKLAEKAKDTLRLEFERVMAIKDKLAAESRIGATEKGRAANRQDDKLRSLIASLEGMNRFALQMGLITPADSREIYAEAMKRGLYQGWK